MHIEVKIDSACIEPRVIILTERMSEEVGRIIERLSQEEVGLITGQRQGALYIIEQQDIVRIYAQSGEVIAVTGEGEFSLRQRLYALEEMLDRRSFVRISNSEIINLKKVKRFDLSISGTVCVEFADGSTAFASRRYVSKIKQILGL